MRELIVTEVSWEQDPHLNAALDEAIHRNVEDKAILRFWRNANAVVIGRYQCPLAEVNPATCSPLGTKIIRRHTGGGAVYHDEGNLNISFALPKKNSAIHEFQSLRTLFVTAIISTLRSVVAGPYIAGESSILTATGSKLCGIAGSVNKFGYFIHASLLISSNLAKLRSILASEYKTPPGFVASRRSDVINLENLAKSSISMDNVKQSIASQMMITFEFEKSHQSLDEKIIDDARRLVDAKYRRATWLLEPCLAQGATCAWRTMDVSLHGLLFENAHALFVRP